VPACERPVFVGLPKVFGVSFIELSKATGRSLAPGGFRFLLGLPCGVETGVMKLFRFGVFGRSLLKASFWLERVCRGGGGTGMILSCFPPCEEGKRLVMKLDMECKCSFAAASQ
jgi:hypothetical protein